MKRALKLLPLTLLALAVAILLPWPAHTSTTTLTGTIRDAQGNPLNGQIVLQLPVPATDITTGTAVANTPVAYRIVNGSILSGSSVPLFDVANLQPQNLYYSARVYDSSGTLVFAGNYAVTGTSYNLGAAIPTNVTTSNISYVSPAVTNASNVFCCTQTFQGQIVSTVTTGTAPFSIASTTLVPNLDINNINGVVVSGAAAANQVLTATSASAANWQSPSSALFGIYTNNTVTGTSAGLLVKLDGNNPSRIVTTTIADTGGAIGICVTGCGASGSGSVSTVGTTSCIFDGATTAADYVQISGTTAGNCHDAGATYPNSGQILGRVLSTNGGGGTYSMSLFGIEIKGPATTIPVVKTGRNAAVCSTGAGAGASCTTTVTWNGGAFADTNYEASCSGVTPTQFPFYLGITSQLAASVTVQLTNGTASEAQVSTFAAISCVAIHN